MERLAAPDALRAAMARAARGKRERASVRRFLENSAVELAALGEELRTGVYVPRPYAQFRIMDPKPRLITCADFRDRVAQHAICAALGPALERRFVADSYACRVGLGVHRAARRIQVFARRYAWAWKADIRAFYDSVDHALLLGILRPRFREAGVRRLLETIVRHPVPGQAPGKGLPIGNLTSQWFANAYLDLLDHHLKETLRVAGYLRYMDDFVVFADDRDSLEHVWRETVRFLRDRLQLELKTAACAIRPTHEGVRALGMRIFPRAFRLQRGRLARMRRLVRRREHACAAGGISAESLAQSVGASVGIVRFFGISGVWPSRLDA